MARLRPVALALLVALSGGGPAAQTAPDPNAGWENVPLGTADVHDVQALADGRVLAASRGGLQYSPDGGGTWRPWLTTRTVAAIAYVPGVALFVLDDRYGDDDGVLTAFGSAAAWRDIGGSPDGVLGSLAFANEFRARAVDVAAADDGRAWAALGAAVWYYPGSGTKWTRTALPADGVLAVHRGPSGQVWAGTTDGLFVAGGAADGAPDGGSWTLAGLGGLAVTAVAEGTPETVWAGTAGGVVYRRGPGSGTAWTRSDAASTAVLALLTLGDGGVLAGTAGAGLRRSDDGGATWASTGVGGTVLALSASPDGGAVVWAAVGGDGLRRSTDGGRTWEPVRWSDSEADHVASAPPAAGGPVVAADHGPYGLFVRTAPNGPWRPSGLARDAGHPHRAIADVDVGPDGRAYALITEVDLVAGAASETGARGTGRRTVVYRSADGGTTWEPVVELPAQAPYPQEGLATVVAAGPGGVVLVGTERPGPRGGDAAAVYRSGDGGATWTRAAGFDADAVTALAFGPGGATYAGTGYGETVVYRSGDAGRTWTRAGTVAEPRDPDDNVRRAVALAVTADGAVVAGLASGGGFRSEDGGRSWVSVLDRGKVSGVDRAGADGVLAAGGDDVYASRDGGRTWAPTGLERSYLADVAAGPDGAAYATARGGLYRKGGVLPVASGPRGVSAPGAALSVRPNPSAGPVTVALALPTAGSVRVAVYDMLGRRVAVVHDGPLGGGQHRLAFDPSALPAGPYVVRATLVGLPAPTARLTVVH